MCLFQSTHIFSLWYEDTRHENSLLILFSNLDFPMALVSLWVPPAPGMVPMVISGWPNLALSPARMMSHIIATWNRRCDGGGRWRLLARWRPCVY